MLADLRDDFVAWDRFGTPLPYAEPVQPAEISDAESMQVVPVLVAALVTAAAVGAAILSGMIAAYVANRTALAEALRKECHGEPRSARATRATARFAPGERPELR